MADVTPLTQTDSLANPLRPGNGVPPPSLAGRDRLLAEFELFLGDSHPAHGIRWALPDVQNVDQVIARLLEGGLVYHPSRGPDDVALPLSRADLRRRADLTHRSRIS